MVVVVVKDFDSTTVLLRGTQVDMQSRKIPVGGQGEGDGESGCEKIPPRQLLSGPEVMNAAKRLDGPCQVISGTDGKSEATHIALQLVRSNELFLRARVNEPVHHVIARVTYQDWLT
jgi:hypothetical protein